MNFQVQVVINRLALATGLLLVFSCATQPTLEQRIARVSAITEGNVDRTQTDIARSKMMQALLAQEIPDVHSRHWLETRTGGELLALFRMVDGVLFWTNDDADADALLTIYTQLEQRNLATKTHKAMLFQALVGARRFVDAKGLTIGNGEVDRQIPTTVEAADFVHARPAVWEISGHNDQLFRRNVDLSGAFQLVGIVHPSCSPSSRGMYAILADPVLLSRLSKFGIWVTPQGRDLPVKLLRQWNAATPLMPISIVDKARNWPLPTLSQTPIFYLLKRGQLVATISGWPRDNSSMLLLTQALDEHGFPE